MYRFQYPLYLYVLALVPLMVLLYVMSIYWRRRKLKSLGDEGLVRDQILGYIPGRATYKFILMVLALALGILGMANLQSGDKLEKVERKGVEVMIALDVSKSMLARDIQPDRLTRAKQLLMLMADKMQHDRVGLIVFAGKSYLQVPLTIDYAALKMMVQNVNTGMVPTQGTVIGDAVDMAMQSYPNNQPKHKALIIISDGEDHDANAVEKVKQAAEAGIIVHTVGIGSPQGATLYDPETNSVKLDDQGNPVLSKLNEAALANLAAEGHGNYHLLNNADDVATKLVNSLNSMEQKNLGSVVYADFTSYFQYFLALCLLAICWEWWLPGARKERIVKK